MACRGLGPQTLPIGGGHEPYRAARNEYVSAGPGCDRGVQRPHSRAWRCAAGVRDMLISPNGTQEMQFQEYVVPSSAAWRVVVRQLELWLEQMKNDSGGQ